VAREIQERSLTRPFVRKKLAVVTALSLGGLAVVAIPLAIYASHGGGGSTLTSSNGSGSIHFAGGTSLTTPGVSVADASWSPDGSRAAFISDGDIYTVRYNSGSDVRTVTTSGNAQAGHPTWSSDGSTIFYAGQPTSGGHWRLEASPSITFDSATTPVSPDDSLDYTHPDGGPNGIVVLQRQADDSGTPTGQADVMKYDSNTGQMTLLFTNGSSPAISPDGSRIAFVRSNGVHDQILTATASGDAIIPVTSDDVDHDNPAWSPDGLTLAFNTGVLGAVATAKADGTDAASPSIQDDLSGLPAYEPTNKDHVVRLSGSNRFGTAIAISQSHWATASAAGDKRAKAQSVVLSRSDTFADAVSGSALAAAKAGPLLMTPPTSLDAATKTEIARVLGSNKSATVYLLGGTGAISQAVQNQLAVSYTVVRLSGLDRYATSIAIADAINPNPAFVLAATGQDFPDALSAGAAAGSYDGPDSDSSAVVVLTNNQIMPPATKTYLDTWTARNSADPDTQLFGIGGQAVAAIAGYDNTFGVVGFDRYATAADVALIFFSGATSTGVTVGNNWPDALAGGALLGTLHSPLLLTGTGSTLNAPPDSFLHASNASLGTAFIFGGILSTSNSNQVGADIGGPAASDTTTNPTSAIKAASVAASADVERTADQLKAAAQAVKQAEH
jgi:Tol biopolymer transport system component